jgi:hypothetical protein
VGQVKGALDWTGHEQLPRILMGNGSKAYMVVAASYKDTGMTDYFQGRETVETKPAWPPQESIVPTPARFRLSRASRNSAPDRREERRAAGQERNLWTCSDVGPNDTENEQRHGIHCGRPLGRASSRGWKGQSRDPEPSLSHKKLAKIYLIIIDNTCRNLLDSSGPSQLTNRHRDGASAVFPTLDSTGTRALSSRSP